MTAKQIPPMDINENGARWRELMELVLVGPDANKWTKTHKAAQFLICLGQRGRVMARASLSKADKKKTAVIKNL